MSGFVDPATTLNERELDREKSRAQLRMVQAQDRVISRARVVAETAYSRAHLALLQCRTEADVARIEQTYLARAKALREAIDGQA